MPSSPLRSLVAGVTGVGLAACASVALLAAAPGALAAPVTSSAPSASAPVGHDPIGALSSARASAATLQLTGWALDPDAKAGNVYVVAKVDGKRDAAGGWTSLANSAVSAKYGAGRTPGYTLSMPMPSGAHTVCVLVRNVGAGTSSTLGCRSLPLGTSLSSTQVSKHKPAGRVASASASSSAVRYRGYVTDPDWRNSQLRVVLYVDGSSAATVLSGGRTADVTGTNTAFDVQARVARGTHVGCLWAVNIGIGSNTFLGCTPVDTRGAAGSGGLAQPALNKAVMTDAYKHKGQPYVWGATGPRQFDCSGLVLYTYTKAVSWMRRTHTAGAPASLNLPRVSEDQAKVARLIPASRAVPGDLVFMFDSEGDVYHVGLYVSPGKIFAAIDYGYGVNYQTLWDPSSVMYGSLTHT